MSDPEFVNALAALSRGDFSRLASLFDDVPGREACPIIEWHRAGRFGEHPAELAEALTCACFLGRTQVARYLLLQGVNPAAGAATGLDALHWAANRGELEAVELLLVHEAPLESRSTYGGTVLGTAVWSAVHEPKPDHLRILEVLLIAGAQIGEAPYPSGNAQVDAVLRRFGAS